MSIGGVPANANISVNIREADVPGQPGGQGQRCGETITRRRCGLNQGSGLIASRANAPLIAPYAERGSSCALRQQISASTEQGTEIGGERLAAQARANLPELPESVQRAMLTVWSEAVVSAGAEASESVASQGHDLAQRLTEATGRAQELEGELAIVRVERERAHSIAKECNLQIAIERDRGLSLQTSLNQALQTVDDLQRQLAEMRRCIGQR